jgi:hypothetical protein
VQVHCMGAACRMYPLHLDTGTARRWACSPSRLYPAGPGSDATCPGGRDGVRSDAQRKGRIGGTGYVVRDMARQVKWADPALRRERARERETRERERTRVQERERERERKKERTHAGGRRACEKARARTRGEKTREREREKRERESGAGTTTTAMGASWAWTGAPARHRRPGEDRRCGCTCSTVVRRGTARGSSCQHLHCLPTHRTGGWRRAVECGSSLFRAPVEQAASQANAAVLTSTEGMGGFSLPGAVRRFACAQIGLVSQSELVLRLERVMEIRFLEAKGVVAEGEVDIDDGNFYCFTCWLVYHAALARLLQDAAHVPPARNLQGAASAPGSAQHERGVGDVSVSLTFGRRPQLQRPQAAHARGREAEFTQVGGWDTSSDSYACDSAVEESDEGDSDVEGSEEHFDENVAEEEDSTNCEDGSDEEVREYAG